MSSLYVMRSVARMSPNLRVKSSLREGLSHRLGTIGCLSCQVDTLQPGAVELIFSRHASSLNTAPEIINSNISYRHAFDSPIREENRPLVLLYSWLVAKAQHMSKYSDFYVGKGFDVIHVKVNPMQLIWPKNAQNVVSQVLDLVLKKKPYQTQPILSHGFSVGGYLYGETLVKIEKTEEKKYGEIGKRLVGQIFDSPVDLEGIPYGMSRAITNNPLLQATIRGSVFLYLTLLKNQTMWHYMHSSETFKGNALRIPTLLFYAENDKIAYTEPIIQLIKDFSERNIPIFVKRWEKSKHVSHFHLYPVEYIEALNNFLDKIGLNDLCESKMKADCYTGK